MLSSFFLQNSSKNQRIDTMNREVLLTEERQRLTAKLEPRAGQRSGRGPLEVMMTPEGARLRVLVQRTLESIQPACASDPRQGSYAEVLAHLMEHLGPHEALCFRYMICGKASVPRLSLEAGALGTTKPDVEARANALSDTFDSLLPLAYPLGRFEAAVGEVAPKDAELANTWQIRPAHFDLKLSDQGSSLRRGSHAPQLVVIPGGRERVAARDQARAESWGTPSVLLDNSFRARSRRLDVLLGALAALDQQIELSLRFGPVRLDARSLRALRHILDRTAYRPRLSDSSCFRRGAEGIDTNEIIEFLGKWQTSTAGHRLVCEVASERPLAAAVASTICRAVFGAPLALANIDGIDGGLDLRGCLPSFEPAIDPFLAPGTLHALGMRRPLPGVPRCLPAAGTRLGVTATRRQVRLAEEDRARHTYIVGATGTGKSTLLLNLALQDIVEGRGLILIDPHGDLFRDLLHAVPRRRADQILAVDFADFDHPPALNLLEIRGSRPEIAQNFICNELIRIFTRVLYRGVPEAFGPVFETYFRNALLLLMRGGGPGATLLDFEAVFADSDFRKLLIKECAGDAVAAFWRDVAERAHGEMSLENIAPYIVSKLTQFTSNALIRPIVSRPHSTLDFRALMDEGRIVLVNLAKGLLGEFDSQLLGMLLLGKVYLAAMGRAEAPRTARRPVHLFVDEFHNIATDSLAAMLCEARKFGVRLTLANQTLSQIDGRGFKGDVADAALANAGNLLVFRTGVPDAERLASWMKPQLNAEMLARLPDHHVAARLLSAGEPLEPFVFRTDRAEIRSDPVTGHQIMERSRRQLCGDVRGRPRG